MTAAVQRANNPVTGASVLLLAGIGSLIGLAVWLSREQEAAAATKAEEEATPEPEPSFDPMNAEALTVSEDCKLVKVGKDWTSNVAFPAIQQQVQQMGRGLAIYPESLRGRAVDVVVRQLLASDIEGCAVPWRDMYMEADPFPVIEPIYNAATARQKIGLWEKAWSTQWAAWGAEYKQLANVVDGLRALTRNMYMANLGVDLTYKPQDTGQYPVGLTQSDKNRLMGLGYDLNQQSVQDFQNHYNLVKNFQTQNQWNLAQLDLPEDNLVTPEVRDAFVDAQQMQDFYGPWMGLVETAINA